MSTFSGAVRRESAHRLAERRRIEHEADMIESNHRESVASVRWSVGYYSPRDIQLIGAELARRKLRREQAA